MRVSEYFNLARTQPTLDFVDVDILGDTAIFVDPRTLRLLPSIWGDECVFLIQSFFRSVLEAIHEGKHHWARDLLRSLHEPNETHLGLSKGRSRGHALGTESARNVWQTLSKSEAVKSGLLEDLEDTILMVPGISSDIISDITTNIIRGPLIRYTQSVSVLYGINQTSGIDSGPLWDPSNKDWSSEFVSLPMAAESKLLLVPKAIVRRKMDYDVDEYYRHYILTHLQGVELSSNTQLVQLLKNGSRRVTKKDLKEKYGGGKEMIVDVTRRNPQILIDYRNDKLENYRPPLSHLQIANYEGTPPPDWNALLEGVVKLGQGKEYYSHYEKAVESLLTTLFYPSLTNPQVQHRIHDGRKRIDITYTNVATYGFFHWLSQHYSAPHVFVECKNYASDVGNPELDQLSGRFSPSRGQVGLLVSREFSDKDKFMTRCRDTAQDGRGFIVPLDDGDLSTLVETRKTDDRSLQFAYLKDLFDRLIM